MTMGCRDVPSPEELVLEQSSRRADDPFSRPPADVPFRRELHRRRLGAETKLGKDAVQSLVARVPVRLRGDAGGTWLAAASPALARTVVGESPHRGPLPQRGGTASGSRAV